MKKLDDKPVTLNCNEDEVKRTILFWYVARRRIDKTCVTVSIKSVLCPKITLFVLHHGTYLLERTAIVTRLGFLARDRLLT